MEETTSWATDASDIRPQEIDDVLYTNGTIRQFLSSRNKHFLVGSKGMGKTLVLKYKRYLSEQRHSPAQERDRHSGTGTADVIFIPSDQPYLDIGEHLKNLRPRNEVLEMLSNWRKAKAVWEFALELSILTFYLRRTGQREFPEFQAFRGLNADLADWICPIENGPVPARIPTEVFSQIATMPAKTIAEDLDRACVVVRSALQQIVNSAVWVFLDAIDQPLAQYGRRDTWTSVQAGLMEAAFDVMRCSHHIRVNLAIRQEAYVNYESPNKETLTGHSSFLAYGRSEILELVDKLARHYEGGQSLADFLQFETVTNSVTGEKEAACNYVARHTVKRPRDFVCICDALSSHRDIEMPDFREIVNRTADVGIGRNVFAESEILLEALNTQQKREHFLSLLSCNVLERHEINEACRKYNELPECPVGGCKSCAQYHPFCELYSIGLVGVVAHVDYADQPVQVFLDPHNYGSYARGALPATTPFYFLHPCLNHYVAILRNKTHEGEYRLMNLVTIGDGRTWEDGHTKSIRVQKLVDTISDGDLRDELRGLLADLPRTSKTDFSTRLDGVMKRAATMGAVATTVSKVVQMMRDVFGFFARV